jgi:phosphopantothenoylcysteine synthetase/decarboxylase
VPASVGAALTVVVCGAPLAERAPEVAAAGMAAGWDVYVVATPAARAWVDAEEVRRMTGFPVLVDYRAPDQPKRAPAPDAVAVCPATFNTVNKWAAGVADNYAMGVLCESLGMGIPIVVVPMLKESLWNHPAWQPSVERLESAGVVFVDARTGRVGARPVPSGTGVGIAARFDPSWMLDRLGPSAQKS